MEDKESVDDAHIVHPKMLRRSSRIADALQAWHEKEEKFYTLSIGKFWRYGSWVADWPEFKEFHHSMAMYTRHLNSHLSRCNNRKSPGITPHTWNESPCSMAAIHAVDLAIDCGLRELAKDEPNASACINNPKTNWDQ
jgi:hypothetical protein